MANRQNISMLKNVKSHIKFSCHEQQSTSNFLHTFTEHKVNE